VSLLLLPTKLPPPSSLSVVVDSVFVGLVDCSLLEQHDESQSVISFSSFS